MLVKFQSEVGTLSMFGDAAVPLLKLMGHSGTVPSAILPEDIPAAVSRLKSAVAASPDDATPAPARAKGKDGKEEEIPVSLRQRAFPLIELLERAAKRECEVMWR